MRTDQAGRLRRPIKLGVCLFLVGLAVAAAPARVHSAPESMRFGVDVKSLAQARSKRLPIAYASIWVGPWTQKYGWDAIEGQLELARRHHVTPVINWWYWGDDISAECVQRGCRDRYHGIDKDGEGWRRLSIELTRRIDRAMDGREAIVVLEPEFNKGGVDLLEAFDAALAEQARLLRSRANVRVVIAFGNWGHSRWSSFDRAVAEADYVGTQLMRSSVRDAGSYMNAVDALVAGAQQLQRRFRKPSLIVDLALSSYPAADYEQRQAAVTRELFDRLPELKQAGVRGILYRMMSDDKRFDTRNYHGIAERHWGLLRGDGSDKPAFSAFADGLRRENGSTALAAGLD